MENKKNDQDHEGDLKKRGESEIKEGDAAKSRPEYGVEGGKNTSTREDQLPKAGNEKSSSPKDSEAEQLKGSDADTDHDGDSTL